MIIEIPYGNSIVKWKKHTNDEWNVAEISDLIEFYETRVKKIEVHEIHTFAVPEDVKDVKFGE